MKFADTAWRSAVRTVSIARTISWNLIPHRPGNSPEFRVLPTTPKMWHFYPRNSLLVRVTTVPEQAIIGKGLVSYSTCNPIHFAQNDLKCSGHEGVWNISCGVNNVNIVLMSKAVLSITSCASYNSKCWKLVFRAFLFMGMFD